MITPRYHREIPQRYRLEAGKCTGCGKVHFPPRRVCKECFGREFETVTMPTMGKVLTYTVIDIPPAEFDNLKPYVVAIVELENGVRLTCMVAEAPPDKVEIGTKVEMIYRRLQTGREWEVLQYGYKARVI
ncbi:MAG: Zn-ribbon domain-containing OB-fold protein [Gemmatimonadales bacterium]|nr:Zn-ribbon domain-containing OB-fold protein [Gemmatimonadales bacterium]